MEGENKSKEDKRNIVFDLENYSKEEERIINICIFLFRETTLQILGLIFLYEKNRNYFTPLCEVNQNRVAL